MDHSIKGYLCRQSQKELKKLLQYCSKKENTNTYGYLAKDIQCVLSGEYTPSDVDMKYESSLRGLRVKDDH